MLKGLVFEGARDIIERDRPIIFCECSDLLLPKFGHSAQQIINGLIDQSYSVLDVETGRRLSRRVPFGFDGNIIAFSEGSREPGKEPL